jgi:hypothetical protein
MRRSFYLLLMLVLVLRGLTGTAMAAGMAAPGMPGAAVHSMGTAQHADGHSSGQVQAHAHSHQHSNPSDTAVHAQAPCHAADTAGCTHTGPMHLGGGHHSGESTCSACEICHSAMLALPVMQSSIPARMGTSLPDTTALFHSAPAALAFEPPIA